MTEFNLLNFKNINKKLCHCSPYCWQLAPKPCELPPPPKKWLNAKYICNCGECENIESVFETHNPTRQEVLDALKDFKMTLT